MSNTINNTSEYWAEMDFDVSSYCIRWDTEKAKQYLEVNGTDFIYRYVLLANKYGILQPHHIKMSDHIKEDVLNLIKTDKTIYSKDWINFRINNLYIYGKELLYNSYIYILREIQ